VASFGLSRYIRNQYDIDGANIGPSQYLAGQVAGLAGSVGTIAAGGTAVNIGIRALGGAETLFHFTSAANAASIVVDGEVSASATMVRNISHRRSMHQMSKSGFFKELLLLASLALTTVLCQLPQFKADENSWIDAMLTNQWMWLAYFAICYIAVEYFIRWLARRSGGTH
jgi:hypothetical protein